MTEQNQSRQRLIWGVTDEAWHWMRVAAEIAQLKLGEWLSKAIINQAEREGVKK